MSFLQQRSHILESIENSTPAIIKSNLKHTASSITQNKFRSQSTKSSYVSQERKSPICHLCEKSHYISQCQEFRNMSPVDRLNKARALKLCINCLSPNHSDNDCGSISCRRCKKRHNTLLHLEQPENTEKPSISGTLAHVAAMQEVSTTQSFVYTGNQVLLSTILLVIDGHHGRPQSFKIILWTF
jgi:hypothetical protein